MSIMTLFTSRKRETNIPRGQSLAVKVSSEELVDTAGKLLASGVGLPQWIQGGNKEETMARLFHALQKANDIGLSPTDGLSSFYYVNGKLALNADVLVVLAERRPEVVKVETWFSCFDFTIERKMEQVEKETRQDGTKVYNAREVKTTKLVTNNKGFGVRRVVTAEEISSYPVGSPPEKHIFKSLMAHCRVIFYDKNGDKVRGETAFSWNDAIRAGLAGKDNWRKYPQQMLLARVRVKAIREFVPEAGFGLYTPDELGSSEYQQSSGVSRRAAPQSVTKEVDAEVVEGEGQ